MQTSDKIKKGLERCSTDECHGDNVGCPYITSTMCIMDMANDALAYINQLEQSLDRVDDTHPKWISVKDMLPACYKDVLVITRKGNELWYTVSYLTFNGVWSRNVGGKFIGVVTHWMPLPEPPKED